MGEVRDGGVGAARIASQGDDAGANTHSPPLHFGRTDLGSANKQPDILVHMSGWACKAVPAIDVFSFTLQRDARLSSLLEVTRATEI